MRQEKHFIIIYSLFIITLFALFFTYLGTNTYAQWECIETICTEDQPAGEEWLEQNCASITTEQGEQVLCQLFINGVEQIIPLEELAVENIRTCTEFTCVQEVRVREVRYVIE